MEHTTHDIKVVCFRVAESTYALDIMRVREIIKPLVPTALPEAPPYVKGVINLRGGILPVVDLRSRFGLPARPDDQGCRYIIVRVASRSVGIIVDAVTEVATLAVRDLRPPPTVVAVAGYRYLIGVCLIKEIMVLLVNPDRILERSALVEFEPIPAVTP